MADGEWIWPLRDGDRYVWRELSPGRYRWTDFWSGISSAPFDLREGHPSVTSELDLSSVAVVRGRVVLPDGCPGTGIAVERLGGPDGMLLVPRCPAEFGSGVCAIDGSFSIRVPGTLPVRLRAWGRPIDSDAPRSEVEVVVDCDGVALTANIDPCKAWVERLVHDVPAIEPRLLAHIDHNWPDLLPHVFFGDLTRLVVGGFWSRREHRADSVKILALLEEAMGSPDEAVQNLVSVSFCENLVGEKPLEAIRAAMGPRLRAELAKHEGA